ncbi:hypothetical protein BOX15_Mlig028109g1 [Macrostomum lignano]|uniref:Uncharacterized protein n=3 Tax=Macrostomum lignano TaxID=282301 RepID=A0A267G8Y2_9PLAT|nr:hypothetical protein BOX15_Mlig028109g3 [Macrostomum lignano]PAA81870.1 hypothetical protein BOX15_Mlig028109g2 [Macrostomum lignano]PAA81877.1 hypothetical protein BOX15_Mlig028109g1 [Macrostomum lignano]
MSVASSAAFIYGLCTLCLFSSICQLAAGEVECYVCPEDKLSRCAPTGTTASFTEKVEYILKNCTYGCGKLVSVNPKPPTKGDYVGLRNTVRDLEYKYCASKQGWSGCYKSESAITTSIECVCTGNRCNGAQRPGSQPFMLAAPALMLLAAVKAQLSA